MTDGNAFTPAAGRFMATRLYDLGVAVLTREKKWRSALLDAVAPQAGETILDVGCGTGTFAMMIKRKQPGAHVIAIDPDPQALEIAQAKALAANVEINWQLGFARDADRFGPVDKVVSSLVLHQMPVAQKHVSIEAMLAAAGQDGKFFIADYARPSNIVMRQCFRIIQLLDGRDDTQPNIDGFIEEKLSKIKNKSSKLLSLNTPTGTISIFEVFA